MEITPRGKLSKKEAWKNIRDNAIVLSAVLVPHILEIIQITDFGEYSKLISLILLFVTPWINRYFNIARV